MGKYGVSLIRHFNGKAYHYRSGRHTKKEAEVVYGFSVGSGHNARIVKTANEGYVVYERERK